MPLNSRIQGPHSNDEMEKLTSFTNNIEEIVGSFSTLSLNDGPNSIGTSLANRARLLSETVHRVDNPILKSLAADMLSVMANWFDDPSVICCLVQAIWDMYNEGLKNPNPNKQTFTIEDTKFVEFLDGMISFIDLIIVLISQDLKKLVVFIPDFMKELTSGVMGSILLIIQETLYVLRDSSLNSILEWIDQNSTDPFNRDSIWAKCLPATQLINIFKRYVHDYGMLADIMEKIRGYIGGLTMEMGAFQKGIGFVESIDNVEYLKWLRDLLVKLKRATVSFELCVNWNYIDNQSNPEDIDSTSGEIFSESPLTKENYTDIHDPEFVNNIQQNDDGSLSINNEPSSQISGTGGTGVMRGKIASSTIKSIGRMYGFPEEIMDQAYATYTDGDLGSVLNPKGRSNNDNFPCPGSPGDNAYFKYVKSQIRQNRFRNT